jgi:hypothetical protein
MRILIWHLHGSWLTSFVQGPHQYLVPVTPSRGPFGLGRARTWDWPPSVVEVTPQQLRDEPVDLAELHAAAGRFTRDPGAARAAGQAAREAARARYGLTRFLRDWDQLLQEVGG